VISSALVASELLDGSPKDQSSNVRSVAMVHPLQDLLHRHLVLDILHPSVARDHNPASDACRQVGVANIERTLLWMPRLL
jgi:hypothetical protein